MGKHSGGSSGNGSLNNEDFIAGRVSRKDRRQAGQDSQPSGSDGTAEHAGADFASQPYTYDAGTDVPDVGSTSQAFLGPGDDQTTRSMPTFEPAEAEYSSTQATQAYHAHMQDDAGFDAAAPGAGYPPQIQPDYGESDPYEEAMTATQNMPPIAEPLAPSGPPPTYVPNVRPTGEPDDDYDTDEEKSSPLLLILSIVLVALLLVITGLLAWAWISKDNPAPEPSETIETSTFDNEDESESPSLTPSTTPSTQEESQDDGNKQDPAPRDTATPAPQPQPTNKPEPQPTNKPDPKPTSKPEPEPSQPAPENPQPAPGESGGNP